uniref:Uncharacterized protein n=1 Tax=Romanomermis culicivorax TaxID=13658 RepID=A0A915HJU0_ROMCU
MLRYNGSLKHNFDGKVFLLIDLRFLITFVKKTLLNGNQKQYNGDFEFLGWDLKTYLSHLGTDFVIT